MFQNESSVATFSIVKIILRHFHLIHHESALFFTLRWFFTMMVQLHFGPYNHVMDNLLNMLLHLGTMF